MNDKTNTKYEIKTSNKFNKQLKKIINQGKELEKLMYVVVQLANGIKLESKYKDHALYDNKYYNNCRECHIESDWLLIYKYLNNEIILYLVATGSHAELFNM